MAFWKKFKNKLRIVGPGFITGAADDDPSGLTTYSIAGARFGYGLIWLNLFLFPSMVTVQEMCGRLGLIKGRGLASVIVEHRSKKMAWVAVWFLAVANVINIGANLGIIAAVLNMLLGWSVGISLVGSAILITAMEIFVPYSKYVNYLKWLSLILVVYIITAVMIGQDWGMLLRSLVLPRIEWNTEYIMTMVGFAGTTISPYLFFWQASQEVEEEIDKEKITDFGEVPKVNSGDIRNLRFDTIFGMLFSTTIALFITVTTAGTLHAKGILNIESPQQAALALRPLAGDFAYWLFGLGIIGIGFQSIPVLAGSVGYAFSELLGAKEGLSKKFSSARVFYLVIALATVVGGLLNFFGVNVISALFWTAIVNGVVSVPLIAIVINLSSDEKVVGRRKIGTRSKVIGWLTFTFMLVAVTLLMLGLLNINF